MRTMKQKATEIKAKGTYLNTTGNATWKHDWYDVNGFLCKITYKNGKLDEVSCLGR